MDNIITQNYEDAYRLANNETTKVRVITRVRYYLPSNPIGFTAKQIINFTKGLTERAAQLKKEDK